MVHSNIISLEVWRQPTRGILNNSTSRWGFNEEAYRRGGSFSKSNGMNANDIFYFMPYFTEAVCHLPIKYVNQSLKVI